MERKLNFGSGSIVADGWYNVDLQDFGQQFIGSTELFPDNHFDCIVAHCSLQMVEWHELPNVLKELHRILVPGGWVRISLPDIEKGFKAYQDKNIDWFPNSEADLDVRFSSWLTWYSTTKTLLTIQAINKLLDDAGFTHPFPFHSVFPKRVLFGQTQSEMKEIAELDQRKNEVFFIELKK